MKLNITKEWLERMAALEDGCEVSAGSPYSVPLMLIVARAMCERRDDTSFDDLPTNKGQWIEGRGMFGGRYRDVNEPMQCDYLDMADAAIRAIFGEPPVTANPREGEGVEMNESDLSALDLEVAKCEGLEIQTCTDDVTRGVTRKGPIMYWYQPTRDPAEAMRLLERHKGVVGHHVLGYWACSLPAPWIEGCEDVEGTGETPMQAICAAVVALRAKT